MHYQFEVILMPSIKQMQICTGVNSLIPCNNESKSSRNLYFSFIVLVPREEKDREQETVATGDLPFDCVYVHHKTTKS